MKVKPDLTHLLVPIPGLVLVVILGGGATPVSAKTGRTYYPKEVVAAAREKVKRHDWAEQDLEEIKQRTAHLMEMSDQELWDYVPPADQLRATHVAFGVGCPQHGEIPRYSWKTSRDRPFKLQCPKGGEWYPSNDFVPWHDGGKEGEVDTTKKYVDDGTGYEAPDGQKYYFIAYYVHWQRWRKDIMDNMARLGRAYMLTEEPRYAHKAAVLMAAVARMYPNTEYSKQSVHAHQGPPPNGVRGGILNRIWENASVASPSAVAYDAIFPIFGNDPELAAFLKSKGIDDPRTYIEDRLLFEMVNRITGGPEGNHKIQIRGNFGMYQRSLSQLAVALDNNDPKRGMTTRQMVDWLMAGDGGEIRDALWNTFYRDGHSGESSHNYSRYSALAMFVIADTLRKVGINLIEEQPKLQRLAEVYLDLAVLGRHTPSTGDTGSVFGVERLGWNSRLLLPVFETAGSPRLAQALKEIGIGEDQDLWNNPPVDRIRRAAESFPRAWPRRDRVLGGSGTAIIESKTEPVGMSLYYGYSGGGHGHFDNLNIELFAFGKPMLPDLGYPHPLTKPRGYNKRRAWTGGTISHYDVVVNRHRQNSVTAHATKRAGDLKTLLSAPGVQIVDASAEQAYADRFESHGRMIDASEVDEGYPENVSLYRRTSLLIDQPDGKPYLFDLFRVQGGGEHAWSFHGPPNTRFETRGLDLGPVQESGTLAGPDIAFGEKPEPPTHPSSGFQYLRDIRKAEAPERPWGAQWVDEEKDENLRLTVLPGSSEHIAIGRSEPEQRKNKAEPLPYILAFNGSLEERNTDLGSDFAAVVEPYRGKPNITRARRLDSRGADHSLAAAIERSAGTDYVLSTLNEHDRVRAGLDEGALMLQGQLGLVRHHRQKPSEVLAVNAQHLRTPRVDILQTDHLAGRVESVDYQAKTVRLDMAIPNTEALVGQTITFRGTDHGEAYDIVTAKAKDGATILTLDTPLIVGTGKVKSIEGSGALTTDTRFNWQTVDGGDHTGRMLLGPDQRRGVRILQPVRDGKIKLDGSGDAIRRLFSGEKKNRPQFWIGSVGAGDPWRIPTYVHVRRTDSSACRVRLNAPARLTLTVAGPNPDASWAYQDAAGQWQPLEVERPERNQIRFNLDPADLENSQTTVRRRSSKR